MLTQELQSSWSDLLAEVNAEDFQSFKFGKGFKTGIGNCLFHVISANAFKFFWVFEEGEQRSLVDVFA